MLRILPAAAGTGIIFRRVDLDGFTVEAVGRNVARVSYATSLMKKGVLISTTEHLLSAFIGLGVDNAAVELDNLELPILDGSARPFVEMVQKVGLKAQRRNTFGFLHDAEAMRNLGLIRGASAENVIVLSADGILNPPLRYEDEFVRHKVLDLIGDLALLGRRIIGRVVADRAGHAMHTALVSRILRDRSLWEETSGEAAVEPALVTRRLASGVA